MTCGSAELRSDGILKYSKSNYSKTYTVPTVTHLSLCFANVCDVAGVCVRIGTVTEN